MNKKKYITFSVLLSLLCMNNVYAENCNMEIIQDFQGIQDIYKINYRYNVENESYTIILKYSTNPTYEYKIYDKDRKEIKDLECNNINSTTKECHYFKPGTYKYDIYGENNTCRQTVKIGDIQIKELKNYSTDPLCKGIEEFVLCQKDYYKDLDYETFVSRVNIYKKTKQEKIEKENIQRQEEQKNAKKNQIKEYIEENLVQIIIIVVFVILLIVTLVVGYKTMRKSRRLE